MNNLILSIVSIFALLTVSVFAQYDTKMVSNTTKSNIVETAISAGDFTTLVTALTKADLVSALEGDGPFTVFAPTDEAFKKLPKDALNNLLKDKEALKNVLLYHVVSGDITSKQITTLNEAKTLNGSDLKIKVYDGKVMVNKSQVIGADVMASNGIIHVIDTVLIPPTK